MRETQFKRRTGKRARICRLAVEAKKNIAVREATGTTDKDLICLPAALPVYLRVETGNQP